MVGFHEAFDTLYRKAYQVAYCILGHRQAAEDAAQEAVARTYVHWPRAAAHPEGWVARVSASLAIGTLRQQRRHSESHNADQVSPPVDTARLELQEALRSLPRRQRQVVVLRYLADLPEAEVAIVLRCSTGTVKKHASRGLAALRLLLES
jgi:RNA polymerase sigma factor (sigma-70 family)